MEVHTAEIWVWDGEEPNARKRTLVITRTKDKKPKVKYSFSNGGIDAFAPKEYAVFQTQRYWIERTFDDFNDFSNLDSDDAFQFEDGIKNKGVQTYIGWKILKLN